MKPFAGGKKVCNYLHAKIPFNEVKKDIKLKLQSRDGVKEIFNLCQTFQIPLIILSAGIKNIIEYWCLLHKYKPDLILSTELILDNTEKIVGWDKIGLVHVLNKNEHSLLKAAHIKKVRPNIILIGDSIDDAQMADGDKTVLRVFVSDHNYDEKNLHPQKNFGNGLSKFDIHLNNGSLKPVMDIMNLIIQKDSNNYT
jgi:2-hydroxy-3-keto-5-methylthiopentenyl-1-phosphate phosphatase